MISKLQKRNNFIKLSAVTIVSSLFFLIFFITDKIILKKYLRLKNDYLERDKLSRLLDLKNLDSLDKFNFGNNLEEGSLINKVVSRGGHHDNETDYTNKSNGKNIIWIMGDSWGELIKKNEIKNKNIENILKNDYSNLRFITNKTWSILLMNIAARHRNYFYKESPDIIFLFVDQTDIGDDFCRYRPFVERDLKNKLQKVHINQYLVHDKEWVYRMLFNNPKSGLLLIFQRMVHKLYLRDAVISGLTNCNYEDIVPWQKNYVKSSNGSSVKKYEQYFKENLSEFINELKLMNPKINIIIGSHDWAQHDLSENHKDKFRKNISSLIKDVADNYEDVESWHFNNEKYKKYNINPKNIYLYPEDRFSHLKDSSYLSIGIAEKIKRSINN